MEQSTLFYCLTRVVDPDVRGQKSKSLSPIETWSLSFQSVWRLKLCRNGPWVWPPPRSRLASCSSSEDIFRRRLRFTAGGAKSGVHVSLLSSAAASPSADKPDRLKRFVPSGCLVLILHWTFWIRFHSHVKLDKPDLQLGVGAGRGFLSVRLRRTATGPPVGVLQRLRSDLILKWNVSGWRLDSQVAGRLEPVWFVWRRKRTRCSSVKNIWGGSLRGPAGSHSNLKHIESQLQKSK